MIRELEHLYYEESLRDLGSFTLQRQMSCILFSFSSLWIQPLVVCIGRRKNAQINMPIKWSIGSVENGSFMKI